MSWRRGRHFDNKHDSRPIRNRVPLVDLARQIQLDCLAHLHGQQAAQFIWRRGRADFAGSQESSSPRWPRMLLTLADGVFEPWCTERKRWRRPESSGTLPREAPLKRVIRSWQPHGSGGGCGEQPSQGGLQRSEAFAINFEAQHQPATPRGSRSSAARASSTFTKFIRKTTPGRSCRTNIFCRPHAAARAVSVSCRPMAPWSIREGAGGRLRFERGELTRRP